MDFSKCWYKGSCSQQCSESCIRYLEMNYLVQESGLPTLYQYPTTLQPDDIDYESFERLDEIKNDIVDFVNAGKSLYICGKIPGTGKTSWASKLMLRYFNEVWAGNGFKVRGLFLHVPTILLKFKDFENKLSEEYKQNILNTDLIIWDDIGSIGLSNYDLSQLLMYLDARILNNKANIYTSNVIRSVDLQWILDPRLASRIWNMSEIIKFNGEDKRGTK